MAYWLFKEEPTHYSFADLERDGESTWDGVKNNLAKQYLHQVKRGDRILYYHTGKEKAVVGEMIAVSTAPARGDDVKGVDVRVRAVRKLQRPVSLERIKKDPMLSEFKLVRMPRLSVVPVTKAQWDRVRALSQEGDSE